MQKGNTLRVPVSGQVTGIEETEAVERCLEAKQFAPGARVEQFEHEFAEFVGKKYGVFCNSGSSANLLAVTAWKRNYPDELPLAILPAVMFPTTLNPYIQNNFWLKIVDIDLQTLQTVYPNQFGVHTLGNYSEIYGVEDSCDAILPGAYKADMQTFSFFPAHFMTTGEGGMVTTNNAELYRKLKQLRDWGRDCWCRPGSDDTCGKRFDQQFGNMPEGYDHKYIYTEIGYNLAGTELAAAIGIEQLRKLSGFMALRRRHFARLYEGLSQFDRYFVMPRTVLPDTAWFGYPVIVKSEISCRELIQHLNAHGIGTRPIMAGNITRQPAYKHTRFEIMHKLTNADIITERAFYIGCWHGLSDEQIEYTLEVIGDFIARP